jgi:fructose-1-phosphate kinase PfkB-like protein
MSHEVLRKSYIRTQEFDKIVETTVHDLKDAFQRKLASVCEDGARNVIISLTPF